MFRFEYNRVVSNLQSGISQNGFEEECRPAFLVHEIHNSAKKQKNRLKRRVST